MKQNTKLAPSVETPTPEKKRWLPNPTGENQWTKIKRAKAAKIPGADEAYDDKSKEAQGRQLVALLLAHANGTLKLKGTQIKAAEIVLDRREPRLSSVEQTVTSPDEGKSPLELLKELAPLLKMHPEWLRTLGFVPLEPALALNPSIPETNSAKSDANQAESVSVTKPDLEADVAPEGSEPSSLLDSPST